MINDLPDLTINDCVADQNTLSGYGSKNGELS
jgi:hypothetical protein